jgi:hypothetical protein
MQNKCSRFKVTDTGIEIDSDSVPVANPTLGAYVTRWIYENFPLVKGQGVDLEYKDALSDKAKYSVTVYQLGAEGDKKKLVTIEVKDDGLPE